MGRSDENTGFTCAHCAYVVKPLTNGSYRNHCPACLWSLHVDRAPGDRASACRGLMRPIGLRRRHSRWQVLHQCDRCGAERVNRVADSGEQPDNFEAILALTNPAERHAR